jgi:glycosyltransferase involved in cell wall biosynthesis
MAKVSVVIPTYDCVKYFREAIESIANQTFTDMEIIIVDDYCTDGTEKLIEVYSKIPNIKVIKHERNRGLAESLNDGLTMATGEYAAIQHSDDVSLPQRLEKEVAYLDSHPNVALVGTWCQNIDIADQPMRDGWWLRQVKKIPDDPKIIRDKLLEMNVLIHTSVMFRKSILSSVGWYDQGAVPSEDFDLWLRISEKYDIGIIRETLTKYRHHPKQISNTDGGNLMKQKAKIALEKARKRRGI